MLADLVAGMVVRLLQLLIGELGWRRAASETETQAEQGSPTSDCFHGGMYALWPEALLLAGYMTFYSSYSNPGKIYQSVPLCVSV